MQFAWTVTFGDVLWIGSVVISAIWLASRLINRIDSLEEWRDEHRICNSKQMEILNSMGKVIAFVQGQMEHNPPRRRG